MKKILLASLLAFGFTTAAVASEDGKGTYVGLAYGNTAYASSSDNFNLDNDTDSGYKLYGGYQFNKIVAVEASYTDYGKFAYTSTHSIETTALGVVANLGYNFLDGQLRPFALVGLSYLDFTQNGGDFFDDDNTLAVTYGLGVEYSPTVLNGVGFRALWNVDAFTAERPLSNDTDGYAFGMFSVAVQYKF